MQQVAQWQDLLIRSLGLELDWPRLPLAPGMKVGDALQEGHQAKAGGVEPTGWDLVILAGLVSYSILSTGFRARQLRVQRRVSPSNQKSRSSEETT